MHALGTPGLDDIGCSYIIRAFGSWDPPGSEGVQACLGSVDGGDGRPDRLAVPHEGDPHRPGVEAGRGRFVEVPDCDGGESIEVMTEVGHGGSLGIAQEKEEF